MKIPTAWKAAALFCIFLFAGFQAGCAPAEVTPDVIDAATQEPAPTYTPPLPTQTPIPEPTATPTAAPSPTPLPVTLAELEISDVQHLGRLMEQSEQSSGVIYGILTNHASRPVGFVSIELFHEQGGQRVSLGTGYVFYLGAGQQVRFAKTYFDVIPEGATFTAEVLSFWEEDPTLPPAVLETRGLHTLDLDENARWVFGELYNPGSEPVVINSVDGYWYDAVGALVHYLPIFDHPSYVLPGEAVPFMLGIDQNIGKSVSGRPLSDFNRLELVVNAETSFERAPVITYNKVSLPVWSQRDERYMAIAEATNATSTWQDLSGYYGAYNSAGEVIGLFETQMLGTIFAPGETRPIEFLLSFNGRLKPDQAWASQVASVKMFTGMVVETDPLLDIQVSDLQIEPFDAGYMVHLVITNTYAVEIAEVKFHLGVTHQASGELVAAQQGRIAVGDQSDVIYARPLAVGEAIPVTLYIELPEGIALEDVLVTSVIRGK